MGVAATASARAATNRSAISPVSSSGEIQAVRDTPRRWSGCAGPAWASKCTVEWRHRYPCSNHARSAAVRQRRCSTTPRGTAIGAPVVPVLWNEADGARVLGQELTRGQGLADLRSA